jgi:segregation and condensation protein B
MSDRGQLLRLVEAILFASSEPVAEAKLAERLPEGTDVAALLAELEDVYRYRGVNLVRAAGGWHLRTAPDLAPHLALERTVTRKLSRAAIETLAIIAYHQPVTRAEIEEIRGVVISKGTLDTLMEAGWVQPKGRKPTPGRPVTWVTTPAFLSHFGLDALADLPGMDELRAAGLLDARPPAAYGGDLGEASSEEAEGEGEDEPSIEPLIDETAETAVKES